MLSLAQTSAGYSVLGADLGLSFYAEAEAAKRRSNQLVKLAEEILPVRAALGVILFAIFAVAASLWLTTISARLVFVFAGLSILAEAVRSDWLFRGRERFDLVLFARSFECVFFLVWVLMVGRRPGSLVLDSLGWALAGWVSASIWLGLLPKILPREVKIKFAFRKYLVYVRESIFVALTMAFHSGLWLGLLWLIASLHGRTEVGILTAPYGLVASLVNFGSMLVMAFYPVSATLYRDSHQVFVQSRAELSFVLLMLGLPLAVLGTIIAKPLTLLLYGSGYLASAPVFAILIWLVPIRFIRMLYATSLISSGYQRLHPVGPGLALGVVAAIAYSIIRTHGACGAAVALFAAEVVNLAVTLVLARSVHGEGLPVADGRFIRLLAINAVMGITGAVMLSPLGWVVSAIVLACMYPVALVFAGLLDVKDLIGVVQEAVRIRPDLTQA
jgi:O-antigen/teichoic acid export membrane protein